MANIVVTSTTNAIKFDFGVYYPNFVQNSKLTLRKDKIVAVNLNSIVIADVLHHAQLNLSYDSTALQVDSINGVAPTSNSDLYTKLSALIE